MEQLIRDLLEFFTHRRGWPACAWVIACDVALDEALSNLLALIEEAGAVVTRSEMPSIPADAIQTARLFQNLVGNSIKYRHPDGTPEVSISPESRSGEWLFCVVKDNGVGIEAQYAETVFGIFKRLHGRDNPGTGMGLAICRKIVTHHRGRIWIESTPGEGSAFWFSTPQAVRHAAATN
jgi:light-regulated signal transduction histidine kinase (bacteriophytochrome)